MSNWRNSLPAAFAMIAISACDQSPAGPAPEIAKASVPALAPSAIEQLPASGGDGYAIKLQSGKWCQGGPGETFLSGNEKLCSSLKPDLRIDPGLGAPHRRATMRIVYHQPGPVTSSGDRVGWNESDVQINCATSEVSILQTVTHAVDDKIILTQKPDAGQSAPVVGSPDMVKALCEPTL